MVRFMEWYWAFWVLILFGVPEGYALISRHPQWTLSDTVWRWCDVLPGQTIYEWTFLHYCVLVFMIWLTLHFALRLFAA